MTRMRYNRHCRRKGKAGGMKLYNCRLDELYCRIRNRKLVLFGIGEYFDLYMKEILSVEILKSVSYIVDNSRYDSVLDILGSNVPVYSPSKLLEEEQCVVLICSTNYMYEMYEQLCEMNLGDGIICYVFPLIMVNSAGKQDVRIQEHIEKTKDAPQIQKVIHSFWFSGDEKPEMYQKCIDSWHKVCPDYEIREWNMHNYDYTKNKFMEQAIQGKKWAFASDYARLDVIYHQGGIYLDMDVELLHPMDNLLGSEAFFTFDTQNDIDLGTFAAKAGNPLVRKLMELYDGVEFAPDMKVMNLLCQPRYIRPVLKEAGLVLNGDMQLIDGMVFLSRNYFVPQDSIIYKLSAMTEETLAIHRYNAGWKDGDYRMNRINNNRRLWNLIVENSMNQAETI